MFSRKKSQKMKNIEAAAPESVEPKTAEPKKRHFFRKFFKYLFLLVFLLLASVCAGGWWICQTEKGQQWLITKANKFLAPSNDKPGLSFRITSLSGSLPFNFKIGLESGDPRGTWLVAPDNEFALNWRELPSLLHISALKFNNMDISRFPETPEPEKTPETSPPFTLKDFQALIADGARFLSEKHWWLPQIILEGIEINNALLPSGLLPAEKNGVENQGRLQAGLGIKANFTDNKLQAVVNAQAQDSQNQPVNLPSFSFQKLILNSGLNLKPDQTLLDALLNLDIKILDSKLDMRDFPSDLLGNNINLTLRTTARADSASGKEAANIKLEGPNLEAGHISLVNKARWQSGSGWQNGEFDGNANLVLEAAVNPLSDNWINEHPASPLAMLRKQVKLRLDAGGDLPQTNLTVNLTAPEIAASGHSLSNLSLELFAKELDLPLSPSGFDLLKKENHCDVKFTASLDNEPLRLGSRVWFQALEAPENKSVAEANEGSAKALAWAAGLRGMDLSALGLTAKGDIQAYIPSGELPALDGSLNLELANWQAIQKFIPDQILSGHIKADLRLDNADARERAFKRSPQNALLNLSAPLFSMRPKNGGQPIEVKNLNSHIDLADVFAHPKLDLALSAAQIQAEGMKLSANIKAAGPVSGPLSAEISAKGDVAANIAADWSPGVAVLKKCSLSLNLPASLSPSGKTVPLGVRMENQAVARYGENGVSIEKLDLRIKPSGRLQANGSLAPDKLSLKINLDNVDFKPWQILAPQIPLGSANLAVNLSGSPNKPSGNFNLALKNVSLPGNPLPPFGLSLKGGIENSASGSALALRADLDQKSLKALGCDKSLISARLPLLFDKSGVPNLNMAGPLAANIVWEGALAPIWNLLPMPDMRMKGRTGVNINAEGSVKTPKIKGGLYINKAEFEDLLLGVLLKDINLKVDLSEQGGTRKSEGAIDNLPGSIKLALSAGDGRGGAITVKGGAAIDGTNLDIKANINKLRPLRRRDVFIELSGDAAVSGSALAPIITGGLLVNQGEILLNNLEIMSSVTTLPISSGKPKKASPSQEPPREKGGQKEERRGNINFKIDMLPRFSVEGRGLSSIWTAHLLVSGSPFNPSITGNISSVRGNFDFLGKMFSLTKGVVFFGGGSLSNPLIDMELTNETPDLTAHIIVSGPVNKIKIQLTSDPEMPRDEIISQVLFGRSVGDLNRFEALQLAAGVAQLAGLGSSGSMLNSVKRSLGLDVLRLGTSSNTEGEPGDMTAGGATIEAGKYINDMIYMGVQQGMKQDSTAFIIQMELSPHTNLEVRTEDNNTWGGLKWKYNY